MKVLLDTCVFIWATLSPSALSPQARETIANEENEILVSAVKAWEIATKVHLGKLPWAEKLERDYPWVLNIAGYTSLPIDPAAALRAGRLIADHRDPFDRMIAAQAQALDIPVVSPDTLLDQSAIRRIW